MKSITKITQFIFAINLLMITSSVAQFSGGSGTKEDPWQVSTAAQLDSVRNHLGGHFIQTANIDLNVSPYNVDPGWVPIGDNQEPFEGSFNGSTYIIDGLYFDAPNNWVYYGLFGFIHSATLDSMYLTNVSADGNSYVGGLVGSAYAATSDTVYVLNSHVTGSVTGSSYVGGLVGYGSNLYLENSYTTATVDGSLYTGGLIGYFTEHGIKNSFATGTVTGSSEIGGLVGRARYSELWRSYASGEVSGGERVGGLVGVLEQADIIDSHASGSVTGTDDNVGGLVGLILDYLDIETSYATGEVEGVDNVGGLVGSANSIFVVIENTYSLSDVTGEESVGGLIGELGGSTFIIESYSSGSVTATSQSGGLIGVKRSGSGTVENSYWNLTASGVDSSDGGTGLTEIEFIEPSSFTGFNFSSVWDSLESPSVSYPFLRNNIQDPLPAYLFSTSGDGSSGDPYEVGSYNQLESINDYLSSYFILINDIDASESLSANNGAGFEPIGSSGNSFSGGFNGDGYSINNLTINRPTEDYVGFFGSLSGTVSDLNLISVDIVGEDNVGGLAGFATISSNIYRSAVSGSVEGNIDVGGLIGDANGEVTYSYAFGNVSGDTNVGGFAGDMDGDVYYSYSSGSVSGNTDVGGFIGDFDGDFFEQVYSTSKVSGTNNVGGLIGRVSWRGGDVELGYWNYETSGQSSSEGGDALTTDEMLSSSNFSGFDFTNIWDHYEGFGFPFLRGVGNHRMNVMEIIGTEGWRMMSSPMAGLSYDSLLKDLWTQGFTGADEESGISNVLTWNEVTREFESISNISDIPEPEQGFIVYVFDDQDYDETADGFPKTILLEGNMESNSVSPALSFTDTEDEENDGWNLIGNPYAFPLNWAAGTGWTKTNIDASFYVWNAADGEYQSHNGSSGTLPDSLIAPAQGFWVKANAESPQLTLTQDVRGSEGLLLKKTIIPEIKFILTAEQMSSATLIAFNEHAQIEKDGLDAFKLQSLNSEFISLFTILEDGTSMDVNSFPIQINEPISINLDYQLSLKNVKGMQLSWAVNGIPDDWKITISDNKTGRIINLKNGNSIEFNDQDKVKKNTIGEAENPDKPTFQLSSPKLVKSKSSASRFMVTITSVTSTSIDVNSDLPETFNMDQNYPNPFNPSTVISYQLPENSKVQLQVFDVLGRQVAELVNGQVEAGYHQVTFEARNLASGMYIYRLQAGSTVITKKLTLIK